MDLAVLDVKMPGMDGLEAAGIITEEKLCAVLILTAFSQREVIEQARDAGALAYLVKPFQKSDLVPAIEVAIGRFSNESQYGRALLVDQDLDPLGKQASDVLVTELEQPIELRLLEQRDVLFLVVDRYDN